MTQEKSAEKCSIPRRLQAVRLAKHLTWDGLAGLLEISPSMIYQVRRGDRNLGDVALHRLEEAEISEGLLSADDATFSRLIRQEGSAARPSASNPSLDAYIKMRLECLADIIDTYDSKQMQTLLQKLRKLESAESDFGKVFVQLAEVVTYQAMRKQGQEDVVAPKKTRK